MGIFVVLSRWPIQNIGKIFLWAVQYFQGNTESVFSVLSHKREDISTTNQYKVEKRAHIHRIELDNHGALTVQVDIVIVSGVCRHLVLVCRNLILVCRHLILVCRHLILVCRYMILVFRHLILDLSPFSIMERLKYLFFILFF